MRTIWIARKTQDREIARHFRQIRKGQLSGRCGRKNRSQFVTDEAKQAANRA